MANKTFKRGSSVYTCRCCKRSTRDIHGEGGIKLCYQCYELAGYDNSRQDGYLEEADYPLISALFRELSDKGVSDDNMKGEFADLWDLVQDLASITPKKTDRRVKYTYPEGATAADKKKFRAALRRERNKS